MPRRKLGYHCAAALLWLGKLIAASELFLSSPEGLTSSDRVSSAQIAFEEPFLSTNCGDKPTGPIDATTCDYETVEGSNNQLHDSLQHLLRLPFFKYLQIDLYRGCPFWEDDATCTESTCSIVNVDESKIPAEWRTKALSKVDPVGESYRELDGCYYRDSDFCFLEDPQREYYDLTTIPERYTGYTGSSPHQIWRAIYQENCFTPRRPDATLQDDEEQCLEEKVYNKVISGLHASISTHICLDYLDQTTGKWGPDVQCYITRVASHPERLEYIYFNTVLLLRAISRMTPYLEQYDYFHGISDAHIDEAKRNLEKVVDIARRVGRFDESQMFTGLAAIPLREDFKAHFRNVSRIMDCIECDQCRLWGKVQTAGLATAMKILFELDDNVFSFAANSSVETIIQRSELAALFNTADRFSESIQAAVRFLSMARPDNAEPSDHVDTIRDGFAGKDSSSDSSIDTDTNTFFRHCKNSAIVCVDSATRMWIKGLRSLQALMKGSETSSKTEL
ncbi:endoplasmic reticulum Oxidoreductin 1-domain-containing protein [Lentinula aff. lateritia]|uniref:Endoplasmic reticulum Oxidoreductin 1-domain-containing protein n=1 Tax=Lentinula aff. lateritia TaxID=2804960 RepID=A0ACC1UAJ2_9AGAR|nr:endoplasmic reticulum Oxidoreductin 1-domain-containing protein [Lentinula aff. lateritia]